MLGRPSGSTLVQASSLENLLRLVSASSFPSQKFVQKASSFTLRDLHRAGSVTAPNLPGFCLPEHTTTRQGRRTNNTRDDTTPTHASTKDDDDGHAPGPRPQRRRHYEQHGTSTTNLTARFSHDLVEQTHANALATLSKRRLQVQPSSQLQRVAVQLC